MLAVAVHVDRELPWWELAYPASNDHDNIANQPFYFAREETYNCS